MPFARGKRSKDWNIKNPRDTNTIIIIVLIIVHDVGTRKFVSARERREFVGTLPVSLHRLSIGATREEARFSVPINIPCYTWHTAYSVLNSQ
jgi:hypothetical protein